MPEKSPEERILEIVDLIKLSAESLALLQAANIEIDIDQLKLWYFKTYVSIGSAYVVEYISVVNRQKEKQLAEQSMIIETQAAEAALIEANQIEDVNVLKQ